MNKHIKAGAIFVILCWLVIITVGIKRDKGLFVYQIKVSTEDFIIHNFDIICSGKTVYFPGEWKVERIVNSEIRDVSIWLDCGTEHLADVVFQFDHLAETELEMERFLEDIKIQPEDTLTIKIQYKKEGEEKEFYEEMQLRECVKYSTS